MSVPKRRIVFSARARADLRSIALYGRANWGRQRSDEYRAEIDALLASLTEFPDLGHRTPLLAGEGRMIGVGSHVVYYRGDGNRISIVRILHERVHAGGQLE
ncbi:MAG: type II toxin-antitoxin system RelE/ParE family toxin [Chloroflexia bacterium]|nr:type II toxin-antitoxin system RelE/ParE family toxin [Chloroflexia bacterium]MDQ3412272.1 type II toxin-antitoxin system RelE/ParE family toxin [Chloroflexota bacterium]